MKRKVLTLTNCLMNKTKNLNFKVRTCPVLCFNYTSRRFTSPIIISKITVIAFPLLLNYLIFILRCWLPNRTRINQTNCIIFHSRMNQVRKKQFFFLRACERCAINICTIYSSVTPIILINDILYKKFV